MEFGEVLLQDSSLRDMGGLCRCCLADGCCKELTAEYISDGGKEIYADILLECYDICLVQRTESSGVLDQFICEVCIARLRDAACFKRQVIETEARYLDLLGRGLLLPKVEVSELEVKTEAEIPSDEETALYDHADCDQDSDDAPLRPRTTGAESSAAVRGRRGKKAGAKAKRSKTNRDEAKRAPPTRSRRGNLRTLLNNTSAVPFKWRGRYMCFYCGCDMPAYTDLVKHTTSHGPCSERDFAIKAVRTANCEVKIDVSNLTCEHCSEEFSCVNDVIVHLESKHNIQYDRSVEMCLTEYRLVDLSCLVCGAAFKFFKHLVQHVNNSHPKNALDCEVCSQRFNKKADISAHMRNYHHKAGYKCEECEIEFSSGTKLRAHKERHLQTCNVCFERFSSTARKMRHINKNHLNEGGLLQCGFCHKTCSTKHSFLQHSSLCKEKKKINQNYLDSIVTVDDAEEKKPTVKELRNNLACLFNMSTALPFKYVMNRFRCFYCPNDFVDPDLLREHTILQHPVCDTKHKSMKLRARDFADIKIDISALNCKVCFIELNNLEALIDHLILEHKAVYNKSVECRIMPFKIVKDNYLCPLCPQSEMYRFFGNLLKHMNGVHTNNKLICMYCGKPFRAAPNLRHHIARHHKEASHKCSECSQLYTTLVLLNSHMAKAHGKEIAKCPKCPERFVSTYLRQKHLITVHNSGSACPHCGRLFTRNSLMRIHIRRTHLKEKKVECPVCHTKFFDNFMMKKHLATHGGDRNFNCDVCGKKFLWKTNLRNHLATHNKHRASDVELADG